MKTFASLLMLVIILHCACMGRCLGEQISKRPPCHEEETPPQNSNLCSEGPALEAKSAPVLKCTLDLAGLPCVAPTLIPTLTHAWQADSAFPSDTAAPSLLRLTVLRI